MKCGDIMNFDLRTIPATVSVRLAAEMMRNNSIGFLPACDAAGRLVGVITDRDIATRAATLDHPLTKVAVSEVMTDRPVVCREGEDVRIAEDRMARARVSRLPVVDEDGTPLGVLSLTDVIEKDRRRRALRTARRVLAREARGPQTQIESIRLTPAPFPKVGEGAQEGGATRADPFITGGSATRGMKEFPR